MISVKLAIKSSILVISIDEIGESFHAISYHIVFR